MLLEGKFHFTFITFRVLCYATQSSLHLSLDFIYPPQHRTANVVHSLRLASPSHYSIPLLQLLLPYIALCSNCKVCKVPQSTAAEVVPFHFHAHASLRSFLHPCFLPALILSSNLTNALLYKYLQIKACTFNNGKSAVL